MTADEPLSDQKTVVSDDFATKSLKVKQKNELISK